MRSFFEKEAQEELRTRFQSLQSTTGSEWGKMTPAQMLAHCTAAMQVPLGDLQLKKTALSLIGWMFKGMLVSDRPFGKDSPTANEFRIRDERDFATESGRFIETFDKLGKGPSSITCHRHPFFGKMTDSDWGHLMYKHLDHHFRQFGV